MYSFIESYYEGVNFFNKLEDYMLANLKNKIALITGGGQGLGLGIVKRMAEQGADIVIADINNNNALEAKEIVEKLGNSAWTSYIDVTDKSSIKNSIEEIISNTKRIDILVNNAGVAGAPGSTGTFFRDIDWEFTWKVNVKGVADVTEAVLPYMLKRKYGKKINISSVALVCIPFPLAYPFACILI